MTLDPTQLLGRGAGDWWTHPTKGVLKFFQDIATTVNGLVLSGITGDAIFQAASQSSASNIALSTLSRINNITLTTSGKDVTLPSATGEDTVFDGGVYYIRNNGAETFDIKDNDGTVLFSDLAVGKKIKLICTDDSDAAGTWVIEGEVLYQNLVIAAVDKVTDLGTHSSDGTLTIDYNNGSCQLVELEANVESLTLLNWPTVGKASMEVVFTQDATAGRTLTVTGNETQSGTLEQLTDASGAVDKLYIESINSDTVLDLELRTNITAIA